MNILVICGAGISTSILVENMRDYADEDMQIKASSVEHLKQYVRNADIVLSAPQIEYVKDKVESVCKSVNVPIYMLNKQAYGNMDGKAVIEMIKKIQIEKHVVQEPEYVFTVIFSTEFYTNKIISKMEQEFEDRSIPVLFNVLNIEEVKKRNISCDKIILCPSTKYYYNDLKKKYSEEKIYFIKSKDYAFLNVENIVNDLIFQMEFND